MSDTRLEITEEMRRRYRSGQYSFAPPPVYTGNWTDDDWIRYIFGSYKAQDGENSQERG